MDATASQTVTRMLLSGTIGYGGGFSTAYSLEDSFIAQIGSPQAEVDTSIWAIDDKNIIATGVYGASTLYNSSNSGSNFSYYCPYFGAGGGGGGWNKDERHYQTPGYGADGQDGYIYLWWDK